MENGAENWSSSPIELPSRDGLTSSRHRAAIEGTGMRLASFAHLPPGARQVPTMPPRSKSNGCSIQAGLAQSRLLPGPVREADGPPDGLPPRVAQPAPQPPFQVENLVDRLQPKSSY